MIMEKTEENSSHRQNLLVRMNQLIDNLIIQSVAQQLIKKYCDANQ
jgi:hypothetical protein